MPNNSELPYTILELAPVLFVGIVALPYVIRLVRAVGHLPHVPSSGGALPEDDARRALMGLGPPLPAPAMDPMAVSLDAGAHRYTN